MLIKTLARMFSAIAVVALCLLVASVIVYMPAKAETIQPPPPPAGTRADIDSLQRLVSEFRAELASTREETEVLKRQVEENTSKIALLLRWKEATEEALAKAPYNVILFRRVQTMDERLAGLERRLEQAELKLRRLSSHTP